VGMGIYADEMSKSFHCRESVEASGNSPSDGPPSQTIDYLRT